MQEHMRRDLSVSARVCLSESHKKHIQSTVHEVLLRAATTPEQAASDKRPSSETWCWQVQKLGAGAARQESSLAPG